MGRAQHQVQISNAYTDLKQSKSGKSKKQKMDYLSQEAGSKGSGSVREAESIMHMSVNSVTDGSFMVHGDDAASHDSNDHFSIKK